MRPSADSLAPESSTSDDDLDRESLAGGEDSSLPPEAAPEAPVVIVVAPAAVAPAPAVVAPAAAVAPVVEVAKAAVAEVAAPAARDEAEAAPAASGEPTPEVSTMGDVLASLDDGPDSAGPPTKRAEERSGRGKKKRRRGTGADSSQPPPALSIKPASPDDADAAHAANATDEHGRAKAKDEADPTIETAELSLSGEFFRKEGEDSVPPVDSTVGHDHDHEAHGPVLTQAVIERRARLRRIVVGVVAVAGLISVVVIGKALSTPKTPEPAASKPVAAEVKPAQARPAVPTATAAVEAPKPAPAPVESAAAAPVDSAAAPAESAAAAAPSGDAAALKKQAESFLNRGKRAEAIEASKAAIAADPSDALSYLYLGTALQETGKWKEGVEAYSECVRKATKGPVYECRAMGGKK